LRGSRLSMATWGPAAQGFRSHPTAGSAQRLHAERQQHYEARASWAEPVALLDTVWSTPGQLHPALLQGALEVGREANLVVWDCDHPAFWPPNQPLHNLTMCDAAPAILGVMVRGKWRGERGRFGTSVTDSQGYRDALREANERLDQLMERVGLR